MAFFYQIVQICLTPENQGRNLAPVNSAGHVIWLNTTKATAADSGNPYLYMFGCISTLSIPCGLNFPTTPPKSNPTNVVEGKSNYHWHFSINIMITPPEVMKQPDEHFPSTPSETLTPNTSDCVGVLQYSAMMNTNP